MKTSPSFHRVGRQMCCSLISGWTERQTGRWTDVWRWMPNLSGRPKEQPVQSSSELPVCVSPLLSFPPWLPVCCYNCLFCTLIWLTHISSVEPLHSRSPDKTRSYCFRHNYVNTQESPEKEDSWRCPAGGFPAIDGGWSASTDDHWLVLFLPRGIGSPCRNVPSIYFSLIYSICRRMMGLFKCIKKNTLQGNSSGIWVLQEIKNRKVLFTKHKRRFVILTCVNTSAST